MVGSRSWIGGLFHRTNTKQNDKFVDYPLTPLEEERLQRLQERLQVSYDETCPDHQESLRALWQCAFPNVPLKGLISDQWKDMGWQGANPSTDFRGCGMISLENLLFFARKYPVVVEERWRPSYMGIPFCCCWHQYIIYVDTNVGFIHRRKASVSSRHEFCQVIRRR
ncbi:hypothetical protein KIW84_074956 [Lathyrus oleraceus]|uniref:ELMO domain-containing protein n=1 Tax=Pisum sativum TaxID=3888 RepID=A0A9D4VSS0_PEA|nr:hypothetical protein KIW84_074956 [Pisum sativum]